VSAKPCLLLLDHVRRPVQHLHPEPIHPHQHWGGAVEFGSTLVPEPICRNTLSLSVCVGPPIFIWPRATKDAHSNKTAEQQRTIKTSKTTYKEISDSIAPP
jgi:hypothetical protein